MWLCIIYAIYLTVVASVCLVNKEGLWGIHSGPWHREQMEEGAIGGLKEGTEP